MLILLKDLSHQKQTGLNPLSSLAALLVFTGFRLASPKEFAKTLEVGIDNFVIFLSTIIGVLATDLLIGVAIGILVKLLMHFGRGLKPGNLFSMAYEVKQTDDYTYHIKVGGAAVFSNIISLKSLLADFPAKKNVFFDLSDAELIDHTVMEFIHHFTEEYKNGGGYCEIVGLDEHHAYSTHHLAARRKLP